jgi:hypothetical protein
MAGVLSGDFAVELPFGDASSEIRLRVNTFNSPVDETLVVAGRSIRVNVPGRTFGLDLTNLSISFGGILTLSGDFTTTSDSATGKTVYGARNVELFLGSGPYRLADGSINPDAVGIVITAAAVGIVSFANDPATNADDTFAIYAFGGAALVGLDGLQLSGSVRVRINRTGRAITDAIVLPADQTDNDGDGLVDEAGEDSIVLPFTTTAREDVIQTGVNSRGEPDPAALFELSVASLFAIRGSATFTVAPSGRLDVDIPIAEVAISAPIDGAIQEIFALRGAARFAFGGGLPFALQDFRVTGFSIFGSPTTTIATPPSLRRAPTADLVSPFAGQNVPSVLVNTEQRYLDIYVTDPNLAGVDAASLTDDSAEFALLGAAAANVVVNGRATRPDPTGDPRRFRYSYTGNFVAAGPQDPRNSVEIVFLPGTFQDSLGTTNQAGSSSFFVSFPGPGFAATSTGTSTAPPVPMAQLLSPFEGAVLTPQQLGQRPYVDVSFAGAPGTVVGINGDEIRLRGADAQALFDLTPEGFITGMPAPQQLSATTYRYFLTLKTGVTITRAYVVEVELAGVRPNPSDPTTYQPTWQVCQVPSGTPAPAAGQPCPAGGTLVTPGRGTGRFTVAPGTGTTGTAAAPAGIGPLVLEGLTVGLQDTQFKDGKLVLTVGIGATRAGLAFGGSSPTTTPGGAPAPGPSAAQSQSGVQAILSDVLGTFDITLDVFKALPAISNPAALLAAFDVPGKFSFSAASLLVEVPGVVRARGTGLKISYDPAYDATKFGGQSQKILELGSATIEVIPVGVTGVIQPYTDDNGTPGNTADDRTIPGLVVRTDGFSLGRAELRYTPGTAPQSCPLPTPAVPSPVCTTPAGSANAPSTINFGSLIQFDDLRVGVEDLSVRFGAQATFSGGIYLASGGVTFLPGKPVTGRISDRTTGEPLDNRIPGVPDNEAVRATLEFADGKVKGFKFFADTLRVQIGSVLTLTARDFSIDTSAGPEQLLVSFGAVGAEVSLGGITLGGEARNFGFNGDGSFRSLPGFGVFLNIGGATGEAFKWPSWLPIRITQIGIQWPSIETDPTDFTLTLSAAVTGLPAVAGLKFSGAIEGIQIDVGELLAGRNPIVGIDSIGVSISGNVFGGEIDAALIGGIIKLDANGSPINPGELTPVVDRVFFIGVEGGFSLPGLGGLTIKFAMSELGPLTVQLSVSVPGGIVLEPNTGLAINDFTAGVEFFKSLPSIDEPTQLRGPAFAPPGATNAADWLPTVRQQVVAQYLATKANPGRSFTAAFTSPMTITGSAKLYSIYASQQVFNGQVVIRISTDGKFFIAGILNFAADNISVSAKLYADLSKVAQGAVTVLFLADAPDQVRVLTLYGKLQTGFRNAAGEEVLFQAEDPPPLVPTAKIIGPRIGDQVALAAVNGRGFIDVTFTAPVDHRIDDRSITDAAPEFDVSAASGTVELDASQRPLLLSRQGQTATYRYWLVGKGTGITISNIVEDGQAAETWVAVQLASGNDIGQTALPAVVGSRTDLTYIDALLAPRAGAQLDAASLGADDLVVRQGTTTITAAGLAPTRITGTNIVRYYLDDAFTLGDVEVTFASAASATPQGRAPHRPGASGSSRPSSPSPGRSPAGRSSTSGASAPRSTQPARSTST